ncbi:cytochrome P450 [Shimazuella sp. AN120528]|nr:cytochrome P450 [Shimazuella soli]MCH5585369.1 cytochrome P450 [Shimazuella soli]
MDNPQELLKGSQNQTENDAVSMEYLQALLKETQDLRRKLQWLLRPLS